MASPTAVLKRDEDGVEVQLRGLADRWARVEAELLRITWKETFLRRQQRRLLHGIFAAEHGEDADAVECSPERCEPPLVKVQVPGRVPVYPWWWIWHVCGGHTMFTSNIESHCPWAHLGRCR